MREPTRKEMAEAYRHAVAYGVVEPARAVAWADQVIATGDCPDAVFIDIASAWRQGVGAVVAALARVPGEPDVTTVIRLVLALVDEEVAVNPARADEVARLLYGFVGDHRLKDAALESGVARLDDVISLARQGIMGTLTEARAEVIEFIRQHRAPRFA